jgi:hypothetical protein
VLTDPASYTPTRRKAGPAATTTTTTSTNRIDHRAVPITKDETACLI